MLRTFTLDTNCLIDIEKNRPAAVAVRMLADAHAAGTADVAVIAMSASENQKDGQLLRNFAEFQGYLATLHLAHLNIIDPMMRWDLFFWDHAFWGDDDAMLDLERQIDSILFPNEQSWEDHCRDKGIDPESNPTGKWRNHRCDVQAIWSHMHSQRQVFVTSDRNFHRKKAGLIGLGAGRIEYPDDARSLL
jgi:hypothetical protein